MVGGGGLGISGGSRKGIIFAPGISHAENKARGSNNPSTRENLALAKPEAYWLIGFWLKKAFKKRLSRTGIVGRT